MLPFRKPGDTIVSAGCKILKTPVENSPSVELGTLLLERRGSLCYEVETCTTYWNSRDRDCR